MSVTKMALERKRIACSRSRSQEDATNYALSPEFAKSDALPASRVAMSLTGSVGAFIYTAPV
jgi:hypothetical protein